MDGGESGWGWDKVGERKSRLKESLLLGGQLEEDLQGKVWREKGGGGEMREGFRREESGLRT